jgi:PEP-CTERM motif
MVHTLIARALAGGTRRLSAPPFVTALLVAVPALLMASSASAQGLVYVDADDGFFTGAPNLSPGDPVTYPTLDDVLLAGSFNNGDNLWGVRGFAVDGNIISAGDNTVSTDPDVPCPPCAETAPELKQTVSVPGAGPYDVYVAYWTISSQDWAIAGGVTSGEQIVYNWQGANDFFPTATKGTQASAAVWSNAPGLLEEDNRIMVLGKVGTTTPVGGEIEVFINKPVGQTSIGRRSWFDGVAFVPTGTEVFLTATVHRDSGEIVIENNTTTDFIIESYSITSAFGALDATEWSTISGNPAIDADPWLITAPVNPAATPFATALAEQEIAGGSGGAVLPANGAMPLNLGDVFRSLPNADLEIEITLADGTIFTPPTEFMGSEPVNGDLTGEGNIDVNDYQILADNLHTTVGAITQAERYLRGDFTGDNRIDYEDFQEFLILYDMENGEGAFAQMVAAPEPSSVALLMAALGSILSFGRRRRLRPAIVACTSQRAQRPGASAASHPVRSLWTRGAQRSSAWLTAVVVAIAVSTQAFAVPVTGWQVDTTTGAGEDAVLTDAGTNSPTIGDGTDGSAGGTAIYASLPQVSLAPGEQVTLTGTATFAGMNPTHGAFRWGLLNEGGVVDTFGWYGFLDENSNGANFGNLNSKNPLNATFGSTTFASTTGGRAVTLDASRDREHDLFLDGTYDFTMTVGRYGDEIYVDSSLTSASGYAKRAQFATEDDSNRITFDYNRVGILSGGNLAPDQVDFGSIDVTESQIEALTLQVITSGPDAGQTTIVNSLGQAVGVNYYEISSEMASINLSGWNSLDEQQASGWNETGGSNGLLIAESNFAGDMLGNAGEWELGDAFDAAGVEDLRFFYGMTDGTLVRGLVEYLAGPGGLAGDYNDDGAVDAADYVVWRKHNNTATTLPNDDTPGVSDADLVVWRENFGETSPGAGGQTATATPEPASAALLMLGMVACYAVRRRS